MTTLDDLALPIPPAIVDAPINGETHEIVRAWWDGQRPRMTMRSSFGDHRLVGNLLAEMSWHFAQAYAKQSGADRDAILADVRQRWTEMHAQFERLDLSGPAPDSRPEVSA